MQAFSEVAGVALPLDLTDVDTDAIIPQRWLVTVTRTGLGAGLFGGWRYDAQGEERPEFILNQPAYRPACIIVAGANYGCGSSREHAVWAHLDYGIRAIVSSSYGPIFYENSLNNGLLPVELPTGEVVVLMRQLQQSPGAACHVDLRRMEVRGPDGAIYRFGMDAGRRAALLDGLDDIAMSAQQMDAIDAYQSRQQQDQPWSR
jgi:3-isopropylmalate/(R)-2-methylmalate dehydratase small subunit